MLIKITGNDKVDLKKRRGYELSGYYFDGTDTFVLWKKKFWRKKIKKTKFPINHLHVKATHVKRLLKERFNLGR
jgi:hypothetical protein|tara:strand:+ start:1515 stop:1736 length:222 start_codon:yes stop_codon:yes gene_type:complete